MKQDRKGIWQLSRGQMKHLAAFKAIGEKNKEKIIGRAVDFIRKEMYDEKLGTFRRAIIGVSGGIDSAVTLGLAALAIGPENVTAVMMPQEGISSDESLLYGRKAVQCIGIADARVIPIGEIVEAEIRAIEATGTRVGAVARGNLAARIRMSILFTLSNNENGGNCRVFDTCNRDEVAMGYFTKFGDGASDLNPVGKIYKLWMWIIGRELGVPQEIIDRIPTAELIDAAQSDEADMRISYEALGLYLYLEATDVSRKDIRQRYGYPQEVIDMIEDVRCRNEHKNLPAPMAETGF